jgi:methylmalonyl-CoA mutase
MTNTQALNFKEFTPETYQDWAELITKDLKGKVQPESLVHTDADSISISAYQTQETVATAAWQDNFAIFQARNKQPGWTYAEPIELGSQDWKNQWQEAISGGADALYLYIPIGFVADWQKYFQGLNFKETAIYILASENQESLLQFFIQNYPGMAALKGSICFKNIDATHLAKWVSAFPNAKNFQPLVVSSVKYHLSGNTPSQEIALLLHEVSNTISQLIDSGLTANECFSKLRVHAAVSTQYLQEISKIKTIQILLVEMQAAYGLKPVLIPIHAETSSRDYIGTDADTNLLRHTTEAMSALVGGADILTIYPHKPSDLSFSQRIGRNISHLLREESYLNATIDASEGAWFIRALIDAYASKAWSYFQELSKMNSAEIQLKLQTWQQMNQAFNETLSSKGKLNKIGGNIFPTATPDNEEALNKNWWA